MRPKLSTWVCTIAASSVVAAALVPAIALAWKFKIKNLFKAVVFFVAAAVIAAFAPISITLLFGGMLSGTAIFGAATTGVACASGLICDNSKQSGGGSGGAAAQACSSTANSCGQTNSGFIVGGSCNATPPQNSACPSPNIPATNGFYPTPLIIGSGNSSTLTWNAANATACTITGDNGFSHSGTASGSVSTGALSVSTTFTLICSNGAGGPQISKSVKIIVDPLYKEI